MFKVNVTQKSELKIKANSHAHTHIDQYIHTYIHTYKHTYIPTYRYVCMYVLCMYACMYVCMFRTKVIQCIKVPNLVLSDLFIATNDPLSHIPSKSVSTELENSTGSRISS